MNKQQIKLAQQEESKYRKILRYTKFMDLAQKYAELSTCISRHVGGVLVKDGRVLSLGYNGSPAGFDHCKFVGCIREGCKSGDNLKQCRAIHCESALLGNCSKLGIKTEGSDLFITCSPCNFCARSLIAAGIKRVIYIEAYNDPFAFELMKKSGIELIKFDDLLKSIKE